MRFLAALSLDSSAPIVRAVYWGLTKKTSNAHLLAGSPPHLEPWLDTKTDCRDGHAVWILCSQDLSGPGRMTAAWLARCARNLL